MSTVSSSTPEWYHRYGGDYDFGTFMPRADQAGDQLRRMLEIGIHEDNRASPSIVKSSAQRPLMAEIPSERDVADSRIGGWMWGYPLWLFASVTLLMWLDPVSDIVRLRRFAGAFVSVFVAMPIIYAAIEIAEPFVRDRPKADQYPGRLVAQILTRDWHERYGTTLTYVGGSEFLANNVAVYSPDHPHVIAHGETRLSPWIEPAALRRRGAVLVWQAGQLGSDLKTLHKNFGDFQV
jgi:hypothetical protein